MTDTINLRKDRQRIAYFMHCLAGDITCTEKKMEKLEQKTLDSKSNRKIKNKHYEFHRNILLSIYSLDW